MPFTRTSGGKGVAAVTSATRIRFALGGTIYNAWVLGKEVGIYILIEKKNSLKADNSTGKAICPKGRGSRLEAEQLQMDLITGSCYWSKKIMSFA
ncbi:hypothetical protein F2Q69_00032229 [Brassica cretica]|uniref:Uncharacterized protein n=1 Tax=Brassica cretica TaxID=69181 RepID=A0A8S9RUR3_BRACR|nr:hypothetical protein F2Q69_00032229 [Brassica cretica]